MTVNRRTLAKGAVWATPVIAASALAPAMAASPCAAYKTGAALPASAFTVTYLNVENESLGGVASKQLKVVFGFKVSDQAKTCGLTSGSISSSNPQERSRVSLTNGKSYNLSNGQTIPANGTVGSIDTSCQNGLRGTEACGTSLVSAYNVDGSTHTSDSSVNKISLYRVVNVTGFAATAVYLNATINYSTGYPHLGNTFSVTTAALM